MPVHFYGVVIDQDSNALSGVRVKVGVNHNMYVIPASPEAAKYAALPTDELQKTLNPTKEVVSDANGRFQWTDPNVTGDVLGVGSITKDGYEVEPGPRSFSAGGGTPEQPAIFKMWDTNIHERLITGKKAFDVVPDGRPYIIDLAKGTIGESGPGDLRVWIKCPENMVRGQNYDWSCELDAIQGGLLEEPLGVAMYLAPAEAYIPSFRVEGPLKGGQRGSSGERSFFVSLNNGQAYGAIQIGLYAPYNPQTPGLIRLSYAINPSGSRILR